MDISPSSHRLSEENFTPTNLQSLKGDDDCINTAKETQSRTEFLPFKRLSQKLQNLIIEASLEPRIVEVRVMDFEDANLYEEEFIDFHEWYNYHDFISDVPTILHVNSTIRKEFLKKFLVLKNPCSLNGAYLHPGLDTLYFRETQVNFNPFTNKPFSQVEPYVLSLVLREILGKENIKRVAFTAQGINPVDLDQFADVKYSGWRWPTVSELPGLEEITFVRIILSLKKIASSTNSSTPPDSTNGCRKSRSSKSS
ncbi:hypothetical protein BJ875DRAFT_481573 [Amylocarpus encephaloides]|uniref:2EXR domain-containing protein n=1 Tax=Amylocarpus encephaloides TaxID=45428 RepID=A0A9P8C7W4_9HELO|nr:hypothetical protein BJ875DRAFT_481573 [Amylocarpus encephaloides]